MQPFPIQLFDLTLIQLANWRWSWRRTLIISMLFPALSTAALGVFAANSGSVALSYVITGNIVLSLLFETVGKVSSNFGHMRYVGMLDYLATLPIYRVSLILASVAAFLLLSIPSIIVTLFVGVLMLHVQLTINPLIIVVIPLISMTLCGLGALIGLIARTPEETGSLSTLVTFLCLAVGPVIIPADRLPGIVNLVGMLSPATYAASALRQTLLNLPDRIPLSVDIAVLMAIMVSFLWLVGRRLDWRQI